MTNFLTSTAILEKLNRLGLLNIALNNRDIFTSIHSKSNKELIEYIEEEFVEGKQIKLPILKTEHFYKRFTDNSQNYEEYRKNYLGSFTKLKYNTDENFKQKMKDTSKKYYKTLKEAKETLDKLL